MKSFKEYIKEEMMPFAQTEKGFVGVDNGPVRDNINLLLANVTSSSYATPYHALEVVRKVLAPFSIFPPATNFLDGEAGHEVFEIKQFGDKMGFTNDGNVVVKNSSPYFLYFEYSLSYGGAFNIFCEIVDQDELDEILADVEDEIGDDTTTGDEKDAEDSFDTYKADNQKLDEEVKKPTGGLKKACWKGYTAVGMKKKNGRSVPNCVPISEEQLKEISAELAARAAKKAHSQTGYKSPLSAKEKKRAKFVDKAWAYHDKKKGEKSIRSSSPLYDYDEEAKISGKTLNEIGDTKKGKVAINKAMLRGDAEIADQASKKRPNKKLLKKAERAVDLSIATHERRGGNVLGGYLKHAYGLKEEEEQLNEKLSSEQKRKIRRRLGPNTPDNRMRQNSDSAREEIRIAKRGGKDKDLNEIADTEKGKKTLGNYIKKASHDVAAKSAAVRGFARDADAQRKSGKAMDARKSDERSDKMFKKSWNRRQFMAKAVDKLTKEEMSPGRAGEIAAGRKGSNPAEQGSIAVRKDDENRKNFKVAKKLARKALKQVKNKK